MTEKLYTAVNDLAALIEKHERAEKRIAELEGQVSVCDKALDEISTSQHALGCPARTSDKELCDCHVMISCTALNNAKRIGTGSMKMEEYLVVVKEGFIATQLITLEQEWFADTLEKELGGTKVKLWCFYEN